MSEVTKSTLGGFYVQVDCCTACGVPQATAPDLVGWTNEKSRRCYWIKQPGTAEELDRAVQIFRVQELGCHRYSGNDPAILQSLPVEDCDHFSQLRPHYTFSTPGAQPGLSLTVSARENMFRKLWKKL